MDAQVFKEKRERLGSQKTVARDLGIGESTLQSYENGRAPIPLTVELAMEALVARRIAKPRSMKEWYIDWVQAHEAERFAFKRMNDAYVGPDINLFGDPEALEQVELWLERCRQWEAAKSEVEDIIRAFRESPVSPEAEDITQHSPIRSAVRRAAIAMNAGNFVEAAKILDGEILPTLNKRHQIGSKIADTKNQLSHSILDVKRNLDI